MAPTGPDALALVTREPVGVVAAIVPWNFPLIMAAWKIGPTLAAGNSFILKPSEKSPLTAIRIAELALEAGIPEGVFNVLPGFGQTAGQALALHMDVDCIGFTGSTRTGKLILQYAGQSNMKRVWLECGGKSPNIVLRGLPRSRPRGGGRGVRDLLQPGRDVLGGLAPDRRGDGARPVAREGDRGEPGTRARRSTRSGDAPGCDRR